MKEATAPPALYLSPPAIPILTANPIHYEYIVFVRNFCCYNLLFTITKKEDKWKLKILEHKNSYEIPIEKKIHEISLIIQSLGVYKNNLFKLEIWTDSQLMKTHHYTELHSVIKKISDNELVIDGVSYGEI